MADKLPVAFESDGVLLPLDQILPTKKFNLKTEEKSSTFRRIIASIQEVGLIEPLIVYRRGSGKGATYTLLDGHLRLEALKKLGHGTVKCLIATEDEAYTYNHKVNVIPPIYEHFMILKAIENGVSEDRIATALDVNVVRIREKRDLLNGVCNEAIQLLKDKKVSRDALREFRKVKPMRQIEIAELMLNSHNFTAGYAKCLVTATGDDEIADPGKPKTLRGLKPEEVARIEREVEGLEQDFNALEDSHGKNVLHLVLITGYLQKLLSNTAVAKFMSTKYPEILTEFRKLIDTASLDRGG